MVQYDCKPLNSAVDQLISLVPQLDDLLDRKVTLGGLRFPLEQLREHVMHLVPRGRSFSRASSTEKRPLLPVGGTLLSALFGTATNSQLEDANRKLANVVNWAKKKGKFIRKILGTVNDHTQTIHDFGKLLEQLRAWATHKEELISRVITEMHEVVFFLKG